jgi:hypothetical protein
VLAYNDYYNWDYDAILNRNGTWNSVWDNFFVVYDTGVNSVLARSFGILSELGKRRGMFVCLLKKMLHSFLQQWLLEKYRLQRIADNINNESKLLF